MTGKPDAAGEKLNQVAQLWKDAIIETGGSSDKTVKGLGLGRNFRINVAKALNAAYSTIKVVKEGIKAHAGDLANVDWLGMGSDAIKAITSIYEALVESMPPLEYVACVILSGHVDGVEPGPLRAEIEEFLKDPKSKKLPWYLHMSKGLIQNAQNSAKAKDWFDHLVTDLRKDDWLVESGAILKYKSRNFEFGFKLS
jgi:hypothetical protein